MRFRTQFVKVLVLTVRWCPGIKTTPFSPVQILTSYCGSRLFVVIVHHPKDLMLLELVILLIMSSVSRFPPLTLTVQFHHPLMIQLVTLA